MNPRAYRPCRLRRHARRAFERGDVRLGNALFAQALRVRLLGADEARRRDEEAARVAAARAAVAAWCEAGKANLPHPIPAGAEVIDLAEYRARRRAG